MVTSVGIVGYGHFGQFLHELSQIFFPDITVKIYSRRAEVDGQIFFSLEEVAVCDVVILCGAINEYAAQLSAVLAHALPDTIIVDVATVKKHTSELLKEHSAGRRPLDSPDVWAGEF
jgi:prephenate dehydrogenase